MLLEQGSYLVGPPGSVAEFDRDAHPARECLERLAQPVEIEAQLWRELQERRPELVAQPAAAFDESSHGLLRFVQLADVGEVPTHLDRDDKIPGRSIPPRLERRLRRQVVEGCVRLDGREALGIEL